MCAYWLAWPVFAGLSWAVSCGACGFKQACFVALCLQVMWQPGCGHWLSPRGSHMCACVCVARLLLLLLCNAVIAAAVAAAAVCRRSPTALARSHWAAPPLHTAPSSALPAGGPHGLRRRLRGALTLPARCAVFCRRSAISCAARSASACATAASRAKSSATRRLSASRRCTSPSSSAAAACSRTPLRRRRERDGEVGEGQEEGAVEVEARR